MQTNLLLIVTVFEDAIGYTSYFSKVLEFYVFVMSIYNIHVSIFNQLLSNSIYFTYGMCNNIVYFHTQMTGQTYIERAPAIILYVMYCPVHFPKKLFETFAHH